MAGYSISINAVDNVTKIVGKVNKSLEDQQKKFTRLTAPVKRLGESFSRLSKNSGLNAVGRGFQNIEAGVKKAGTQLTKFLAPLSAITSAASVAGVAALVNSWGGYGRALTNSAALLGTTTGKLQVLESVGQQFGMTAGEMTNGVRNLGNVMQDALMGRAPAAAQAFRLLGIDIKSSAYQAKTGAEQIDTVREALSKMKDPLQQAKVAQELFGGSADAMLPYLRASKEEIASYRKEAEKYSLSLEQTKGADSFARQQSLLAQSVQHFGYVLSAQLAPILEPVIKQVRDFIDAYATPENIKIISDQIVAFTKGLVDLGLKVNTVVGYLGGWKIVLGTIVGIAVTSWLIGLLAPLAAATLAIGALTVEFTAMAIAAQFNPVVLAIEGVIAVIALLSAGAYEAYQHWDEIKGKFTEVTDYLKDLFTGLWDSITGVFESGWKKVSGYLDKVKSAASSVAKFLHLPGSGGTVESNTLGENGGSSGSSGGGGSSGASSSSGSGSSDAAPVPNVAGKNFAEKSPKIIDGLMKDFGLTKDQAAGIVGNLGHESAGFTQLQEQNPVNGGRGGLGWAQWTGPRRDQFIAWAKEKGLDPKSDEANYGFLRHELQTTQAGAITAVKKTSSASDSTRAFEGAFERAGVKNYASRDNYTNKGLQAYNSKDQTPAPNAFIAANSAKQNAASGGQAANGNVQVSVNIAGAPPGSTASVATAGDGVTATPPRVSPMPSTALG